MALNKLKNKSPSSISEEELLSILEKEGTEVVKQDVVDDINTFLSFYNITQGTNKISRQALYRLYKAWTKAPVSSSRFILTLDNFFEKVRGLGAGFYYLINLDALNLSKEALKLVSPNKVDRTKSKPFRQHFINYLTYYDINPGDYWIPVYGLYWLYDKWTYKNKNSNPMGTKTFIDFCRLHFETRRIGSSKVAWFRVNSSIKNYITDNELKELKEGRTFSRGKKKDKQKVTSEE